MAETLPPLTIWPPSTRTRNAVVHRLLQTLTSDSTLASHYGPVPVDRAATLAQEIEDHAFSEAAKAGADGDDVGTLQVYSKEIGKRVLEEAKKMEKGLKVEEDEEEKRD